MKDQFTRSEVKQIIITVLSLAMYGLVLLVEFGVIGDKQGDGTKKGRKSKVADG